MWYHVPRAQTIMVVAQCRMVSVEIHRDIQEKVFLHLLLMLQIIPLYKQAKADSVQRL